MPLLGDILAAARKSASGFTHWLESADPDLAARVHGSAAALGISSDGFVRMAVADFARLASEEDWASLVSAIRNDADPGGACLFAMVHWRLTAAACGEHAAPTPIDQQGAAHARPE